MPVFGISRIDKLGTCGPALEEKWASSNCMFVELIPVCLDRFSRDNTRKGHLQERRAIEGRALQLELKRVAARNPQALDRFIIVEGGHRLAGFVAGLCKHRILQCGRCKSTIPWVGA